LHRDPLLFDSGHGSLRQIAAANAPIECNSKQRLGLHSANMGAGFSGGSVDSMHFELAEETISNPPPTS
jgi:hypothetical protein